MRREYNWRSSPFTPNPGSWHRQMLQRVLLVEHIGVRDIRHTNSLEQIEVQCVRHEPPYTVGEYYGCSSASISSSGSLHRRMDDCFGGFAGRA